MIASVLSQIVDTLLFITISFSACARSGGLMAGQMLAKVVLSVVLVPFADHRPRRARARGWTRGPPPSNRRAHDRHAPDAALLAKAETLIEALPYLQRYAGKTFVVKYGGHAMGDPGARARFRRGRRAAEGGRHQPGRGPRRRAADRRDAQEARGRIALRRRPARHRHGDRRDRRDGPVGRDQQGNRRLDRPGRRARGRHLGQGRRAGHRRQGRPHRARPDCRASSATSISASSASRSRSTRRILDTLSAAGIIPVDRADRARRRRRRPTTSTPTRWPARSPRRWARRGCSC